MKRLAENQNTFPLVHPYHTHTHTVIPLEDNYELRKNTGKYTIPILTEEPCKITQDTQCHREKKSGVDFLRRHFTQLNIEMGIRKGKIL